MTKPDESVQLSRVFQALLGKMRTQKSVKAALSLFTASPKDMGKSASTVAKRDSL